MLLYHWVKQKMESQGPVLLDPDLELQDNNYTFKMRWYVVCIENVNKFLRF